MPEIEILTGEEVLPTRTLWEEVFTQDSKQFVDYYYSHKAEKNICFVIKDQKDIVSMVHLTPYDMCVKSKNEISEKVNHVDIDIFSTFYIVGVATREAYRHRGYMTALLERAFFYMESCRVPFTFLMPANPAIYEPFGFRYIYERTDYLFCPNHVYKGQVSSTFQVGGVLNVTGETRELAKNHTGAALELELVKAEEKDCEQLASFSMEQLRARYDFFLKRDELYFRTLRMELESENGCIYLIYINGELVGYFTYACEEEEFVQEVLIKVCYEHLLVVDEGTDGLLVRKSEKKPIIMGKCLGDGTRAVPGLKEISDGRNQDGFMNEVV